MVRHGITGRVAAHVAWRSGGAGQDEQDGRKQRHECSTLRGRASDRLIAVRSCWSCNSRGEEKADGVARTGGSHVCTLPSAVLWSRLTPQSCRWSKVVLGVMPAAAAPASVTV